MDKTKINDLLVIGGGINGTGIALDAAGRGLSVVLCEQNDLASGTSSQSTKLIHGGLRYLEQYDFKLVRESLNEREVLLKKAPHLISPLRFIIPYEPALRPYWMIRLGLWIYDHLGKECTLKPSEGIRLSPDSTIGKPLISKYKKGFAFSDCWVDDARLVISNAIAAAELKAEIRNYTEVKRLRPANGLWEVLIHNKINNTDETLFAKAIVNATGPWIKQFIEGQEALHLHHSIRLVRGSHIIVPKRYEGDHAYLIQHPDGRIVFVIPYENAFTLIGTTEFDTQEPLDAVKISSEEIQYLIDLTNQHFEKKISPSDIVWQYSGVRPLVDSQAKSSTLLSREYLLETEVIEGAPVLSVYGGKITTYRTLAQAAVDKLRPFFPGDFRAWTDGLHLPGGDLPYKSFDYFLSALALQYPWLPLPMLTRMAHQYGSRIHRVLSGANSLEELGQYFGADCYEKELRYLIEEEWAHTAEDLLYRRTKLGLHLSEQAKLSIKTWLGGKMAL